MKTKSMPAGVFKSKCLKLIDEVQATGEAVIITKQGKSVARLVPVNPKLVPVDSNRNDFYDSMKGKVTILGDIVGPVIPEEEWNTD